MRWINKELMREAMFLANRWHVQRPWHVIGLGIFQKLQIMYCDFAEYMQVPWGLQKR